MQLILVVANPNIVAMRGKLNRIITILTARLRLPYLVLLVVTFAPQVLYSQVPLWYGGSRSAAMGFTSVAITDSWSVLNNQGALGFEKDYWLGAHFESRYMVKELSNSSVAALVPLRPGTFGVALSNMGYSGYSETFASLAYGMMLTPELSAGIGLNYHRMAIAGEYGDASAFSAALGLLYKPTSSLAVGANVFNPTRTSLGDNASIPVTLRAGVSYSFSQMFLLSAEVEDNTDTDPVAKFGVEFLPIDALALRIGVSSEPVSLSFGLGYTFKRVCFDLAFSHHEVLGYTPFVSVSYRFGKSSTKISE
ncbi:MAG: hypothetical protein JW783_10420 [Bacteroidales bacterium]|nr:hypothetical protein [Bacteroidales bacterium]